MKIINKAIIIIVLGLVSLSYTTYAQVGINTDGSEPDASSILDLKSSDKGFLIPRMSESEISAISNPTNGLQAFNTDDNTLYIFILDNNLWKPIAYEQGGIVGPYPFVCGDDLNDLRDGQSYTTVEIGGQCWMSENLNIGTMITSTSQNNQVIEKFCYQNNTTHCDTYGGLYQWNEIMEYSSTPGIQGICPSDWHIPTDAEYKTLEIQLGMDPNDVNQTGWRGTNEGAKLAGNFSLWYNNALRNNAAFGSSGFDALPASYRASSGSFSSPNLYTYFWSSTPANSSVVWTRHISYSNTRVLKYPYDKYFGFSLRCVQN